jgi:hypothetical protein
MQSRLSEQLEDDDKEISEESSVDESRMFENDTHDPFEMFDFDIHGLEEPEVDGYLTGEDEAEAARLSSGDFPLQITTGVRPRWLNDQNDAANKLESPFRPFTLER